MERITVLCHLLLFLLLLDGQHAVHASCTDKDARCAGWAKTGECDSNPSYMNQNCKLSCKICSDTCKNTDSDEDCGTWYKSGFCEKSSVWYGYMKANCQKSCSFCKVKEQEGAEKKECIDKDSEKDCNLWFENGYCEELHAYHDYMKKNCQKSCGFCPQDSSSKVDCKDIYDTKQCAAWQKTGECTKNPKWMNINCQKSCNKCPVVECKDIYDTKQCAAWQKTGECTKNPKWMNANCQKSCKKCPGGTTSAVSSISDKKDKSLTEINGQLCGLRLKLRVVGGNNAAVGDWPWQVGIARATNPNFPFCGGSLINKQWVVTASHCFGRAGSTSVKPSDIVIRLAEHDTSFTEGNEVVKKVAKIIRHEDYKIGSYDADIALIKLESPVEYNFLIKPVCLPEDDEEEKVGKQCYVTGWGRLQEGGSTAKILQEARIPIVSMETCTDAFRGSSITKNMVCAGFKQGGVDACQGDSGGPFVCFKDGRYRLTGVVSFGRGCARANIYGVYTKVSKYVNWIKRKIKE